MLPAERLGKMDEKINEYVNVYRTALEDERETNWVRGEVASIIYSIDQMDKSKKLVQNFLAETGETRISFYQNRWVWEAFKDTSDRELPGVTWSHYRAAAGTADPIKWIHTAHDNGWTTKQLLEAIQDEKLGEAIEKGVVCKVCSVAVVKDLSVGVTYHRKRNIFCSKECAIKWLQENES